MPLKRCGKNGWKWGDGGKCYTGKDAKKQAIKQGIAIEGPKKFSQMANDDFELSKGDIEYVLEFMYSNGTTFNSVLEVSLNLWKSTNEFKVRNKKESDQDSWVKKKKNQVTAPPTITWSEEQKDVFKNPDEAKKRAKELGLDGIHSHKSNKTGNTIYMPGKTHKEYEKKIKEEMSEARFAYKDPYTGEVFYFERPGVYTKNGRMLVRATEYNDGNK